MFSFPVPVPVPVFRFSDFGVASSNDGKREHRDHGIFGLN
jgi:hypothetical protein